MKSSQTQLHLVWSRAGIAAWILAILLAASPAPAQQPPPGGYRPAVTIDGASQPERVPDWILWREMFRAAVLLAEKAPDEGRDVWVSRLHLSAGQMNQFVALARSFQDDEARMLRDAKAIAGAAGGIPSDAVKARLRQLQLENQVRISGYRDRLAGAIGPESMQKMQSFARLHIAPRIRVGELVAADRR